MTFLNLSGGVVDGGLGPRSLVNGVFFAPLRMASATVNEHKRAACV
jgi:hypothetical protein